LSKRILDRQMRRKRMMRAEQSRAEQSRAEHELTGFPSIDKPWMKYYSVSMWKIYQSVACLSICTRIISII